MHRYSLSNHYPLSAARLDVPSSNDEFVFDGPAQPTAHATNRNQPALKRLSIIITTYNRLPALQAVIASLVAQNYAEEIEVLVADDGSTPDTGQWLQQQTTPFPLIHVWQADTGFKAAQIRNRAAAIASGEYLIFIDGDCILPSHFLHYHTQLAQPGYFVTGNRVLLSRTFTQRVLQERLPVHHWQFTRWLLARMGGKCNRVAPFSPLLRWLNPYRLSTKWQGAKTCNLALWRDDFIAINGFDEHYQGWGYEDSDLVIRLLRSGSQRKLSQFAIPVLHLWHPENDRSQQAHNSAFLQAILENNQVVAAVGVNQYLSSQ